jgi:hypothetical protein
MERLRRETQDFIFTECCNWHSPILRENQHKNHQPLTPSKQRKTMAYMESFCNDDILLAYARTVPIKTADKELVLVWLSQQD